jgi:hypothetical protein
LPATDRLVIAEQRSKRISRGVLLFCSKTVGSIPRLKIRYLDEQTFRYNNRKDLNDSDRFRLALSQITDKRLTYEHLTGRDRDMSTAAIN